MWAVSVPIVLALVALMLYSGLFKPVFITPVLMNRTKVLFCIMIIPLHNNWLLYHNILCCPICRHAQLLDFPDYFWIASTRTDCITIIQKTSNNGFHNIIVHVVAWHREPHGPIKPHTNRSSKTHINVHVEALWLLQDCSGGQLTLYWEWGSSKHVQDGGVGVVWLPFRSFEGIIWTLLALAATEVMKWVWLYIFHLTDVWCGFGIPLVHLGNLCCTNRFESYWSQFFDALTNHSAA